jgi:ribonuclease HIII
LVDNDRKSKIYEKIKASLQADDVHVSGYKAIEYGIQFTVSTLSWSGIIRIYENKKGVLKIDYSQVKNEAIVTKVKSLFEDNSQLPGIPHHATSDITDGKFPIIGTDESGKGDYFGPLVAAAVYVDASIASKLTSWGVADSKKFSDSKNIELASKILLLCQDKTAIIEIPPERYNALYEQFKSEKKNLNMLLAWGHAKAIEKLLEKTPCENAISDQFADERFILSKLQEKGRGLNLIQMHRAEQNVAVAAASVVARARFLQRLAHLSVQYKIELPKGASGEVIIAAKKLVGKYGNEILRRTAKLHFKTTTSVLS